jgi:hypothetical protein
MTKIRPTLIRRDATGHMNPRYERELLEESTGNPSSQTSETAFIPRDGDELGEEMGEAFVESVTSGEDASEENHQRIYREEYLH